MFGALATRLVRLCSAVVRRLCLVISCQRVACRRHARRRFASRSNRSEMRCAALATPRFHGERITALLKSIASVVQISRGKWLFIRILDGADPQVIGDIRNTPGHVPPVSLV